MTTVRVPIKELPKKGMGLGDLVKKVADKLGVDCPKWAPGCEKRREALNRIRIGRK